MKNTSKLALVAVSALTLAASANAAYPNGDLIVGFTGGSSDFLYDLGQATSLTLGETWNIGSSLGTQFGVIGALSTGKHIYATSPDIDEGGWVQAGQYQQSRANINTMGSTLTAGNSVTPSSSDTTGWTSQTAQPAGTPGNTFQNNYFNPNVASDSTAFFFDNIQGTTTADGVFSYDGGSGVLTYSAVPEPSTYGLFAAIGLTAFVMRRRFVKA